MQISNEVKTAIGLFTTDKFDPVNIDLKIPTAVCPPPPMEELPSRTDSEGFQLQCQEKTVYAGNNCLRELKLEQVAFM
jgi:hypothetical protein